MKKSELVREISGRMLANHEMKIGKEAVEAVLTELCEIVKEQCLDAGNEVLLPIGKFRRKVVAARDGVNPLTKAPMHFNEVHNLTFKPAKALKVVVEERPKKRR